MSFYAALKNGSWLKLRRIIVYPHIILVMYVLLGIAWPFGLYQHVKPGGALITTDYINVYAAGLTAHEHHAASAYDGNEHHDRQDRITLALNEGNKSELKGDYIPWLYPPMFFCCLVRGLAALFYILDLLRRGKPCGLFSRFAQTCTVAISADQMDHRSLPRYVRQYVRGTKRIYS